MATLKKGCDCCTHESKGEKSSLKNPYIVVLQRGWVVIGDLVEAKDKIVLTRAAVLSYWGTTKGLGELVAGPTSKTKLEPCGSTEFTIGAQIMRIPVLHEAWEKHL